MLRSIAQTSSIAVAALLCWAPAHAASVVVNVSPKSDPYLAGQPAGTACCAGDVAPTHSPTQVPGILISGTTLTFSGTGGFNYNASAPSDSLDGIHSGQSLTFNFNMPASYGTGIAGLLGGNVDGLVGVFIGAGVPSGAAPAQLDYGVLGLNATTYSPDLNQIFWIGDGLTGTGIGSVQSFIVPVGATRLFFGTVDGGGYYNNTGAATVTVSGLGEPGAVPEPASWAMMIGGFALTGFALRRRMAAPGATAFA